MAGKNKRDEIMDATMRLVSETGLPALSTRKVAARANVSDGLMYRYFKSKDELLYACYQSIQKEIAALIDGKHENMPVEYMDRPIDKKNLIKIAYIHWLKYFKFLIDSDYKTLFYIEFRTSPYIRCILDDEEKLDALYFDRFGVIISVMIKSIKLDKDAIGFILTYIMDMSCVFARKIIVGDLPKSESYYRMIWTFMSEGLAGVLDRAE